MKTNSAGKRLSPDELQSLRFAQVTKFLITRRNTRLSADIQGSFRTRILGLVLGVGQLLRVGNAGGMICSTVLPFQSRAAQLSQARFAPVSA